MRVPGKKIAMDQEQQRNDVFDTIEPARKSRSYPITSVEPTRMYCPAFLGSLGWGLQQLISQVVVASVALGYIF